MKQSTIGNAGDKLDAGFKDQRCVKSNTTKGDVQHIGVCGVHLRVSGSMNRTCGERYCQCFLTSVGNRLGTTG